MAHRREARIYCTLKQNFTTAALRHLGFVREGGFMVRRGRCRTELARASSLDGEMWRVTPLVRHWRPGGRA